MVAAVTLARRRPPIDVSAVPRPEVTAYVALGANLGDAERALREVLVIAAGLSIPPLERVPQDHVLTRTFYLLQDLPHSFVVKLGIEIMHLHWICAIVINDIGWNSLAKICLEAVNAHLKERS